MNTINTIDPVERYGDEVLNASWLPSEVLHGSQDLAAHHNAQNTIDDPDEFLHRLYLSQE